MSADVVLNQFRNAPLDDEPVSAEEDASVGESRADLARGEILSLEQVGAKPVGSPPANDWNSPRAREDLAGLAQPVRARMLGALQGLTGDPPRGDLYRLPGRDEWHLRVGDWRVRLELDTEACVIHVLRVLPRNQA